MDKNALHQYIARMCAEKQFPGVSVCIRKSGEVIFAGNYGHRDAAGAAPVDSETIFGIASMSKSMVALALCLLEQEGKVSLEDPVYRFFPQFSVPGIPRDAVTIRHLLMHTAGIPPMEPLEWSIAMNTPDCDDEWARKIKPLAKSRMDTIEQVIDYIAASPYETLGSPGEYMSYCNEGYGILSYVVDQVSGTTLEAFLRERVFMPLGMARTVLDVDCEEAKSISGGNITSLFEKENGALVCDDRWSILPPFRGCGLVKSTAPDMAAYYACLAAGGVFEGRRIWPEAAVERMVGRAFPEETRPYYCLGLTKRDMRGHLILEHNGGLHGVSSSGAALRGEGYGFCVLCNQGDVNVDPVMWALLNAVIGLPLTHSHNWSSPAGRDFSDPEMLLGTYIGHEGVPATVKVVAEDGKLRAVRDADELTLVYAGGCLFMGYVAGDPEMRQRMEFYVRNGRAWGVKCGSRIFTRQGD